MAHTQLHSHEEALEGGRGWQLRVLSTEEQVTWPSTGWAVDEILLHSKYIWEEIPRDVEKAIRWFPVRWFLQFLLREWDLTNSPSLLILSLTAEGPAILCHMNAVTSVPSVSWGCRE